MKAFLETPHRHAITIMSHLLAAVLLVGLPGCSVVDTEPAPPTATMDTAAVERGESPPDHENPPELEFENGVGKLDVTLSNVRIDGRHYCLRAYNGLVTGPTITVPAQQNRQDRFLRLDVTNGLERSCSGSVGGNASNDHCDCKPGPGLACYDFNSTNLHTHGLHVRPDALPGEPFLSDHVLMHLDHDRAMVMHGGAPIPAGACFQERNGHQCRYKFAIDEGSRYVPGRNQHEPGTFWYHAHVHGATAIQLANGMAGALIIRGPVDAIPAIAAATEQVMVLQQIPFETAEPVAPETVCDPMNPEHYSINDFGAVTSARRNLVNGRLEPSVEMKAGEVQRWRLVHAGITNEILLEIEGPLRRGSCRSGATSRSRLPLYEIAADGITMVAKRRSEQLRLDPGYRSDIMVKIPRGLPSGLEYCVVDARGRSLQNPELMEERNLVAVIEVDAQGRDMELPEDWQLRSVAKAPLDCSTPPPRVRRTIFNQQGAGCEPLNIDCKLFPDIRFDLRLDELETWSLTSQRGPHPYHIHVNPFTVCEEGGARLEQPYWRDTLLLEGGQEYEIRSRYLGFTGKFVLHCHRLDHEDRGMMGLVEIHRTDD